MLIFLYLGDFDVHGFDIYLDYLFGSELSVFEVHGNPTLTHIGLNSVDVECFKKGKIEIGLNELIKIEKILNKKCFYPIEKF